MKTFKIYYINLDRSTQRKQLMQKQFTNLESTRIPAVNGSILDKEILHNAKINQIFFAHFTSPKSGEVGCFLSHYNAWDIISKQEEDFGILFEDDALISEDFFDDLQNILNSIDINDFVDITGRKGFFEIEKKQWIKKFVVPPLRTTAQIIGKNSAKQLKLTISEYIAPVDVMEQDIHKHKINMYSSNKKYVSHYDEEVGGSTAQTKNIFIIKKIIREIIRPFWQLFAFFLFKIQRVARNYFYYKK